MKGRRKGWEGAVCSSNVCYGKEGGGGGNNKTRTVHGYVVNMKHDIL